MYPLTYQTSTLSIKNERFNGLRGRVYDLLSPEPLPTLMFRPHGPVGTGPFKILVLLVLSNTHPRPILNFLLQSRGGWVDK